MLTMLLACAEPPPAPDSDADTASSPTSWWTGSWTATDPDTVDADGDGFPRAQDCDDDDPSIHPGAVDRPYDGIDGDCDGRDVRDVDGDGYVARQVGGRDCDDRDPAVHPGAQDLTVDGVDDDCDGVDGVDVDGDGWASVASGGADCDDSRADVYPDAPEVWYDGADADCDGACDYDQDGDGAPTVDAQATPGCDLTARDCDDTWAAIGPDDVTSSSDPAAGEPWFEGEDPLLVTMRLPDTGASLTVTDPAGDPAPGVLVVSGALLTFTPSAPLPPSAEHQVTVQHACGVEQWSFTTAPALEPVDPASLVGVTWRLDLRSGDWTGDPSIEGLVDAYTGEGMLLTVVSAGETLHLRLAGAAAGPEQDLCVRTADALDVPLSDNPAFALALDAHTPSEGVELPLLDAVVTGAFRSGRLSNGTVDALADLRPLSDALLGDPASMCTYFVPCEPCPTDAQPYCLAVGWADLDAEPVDVEVVSRSADDILDDLACP
jgi:hypothetical protein